MIQINTLCDRINIELNEKLGVNSDFVFEFYPDSGNYTPPTYEANSNKVKKRVLGIVEVDSSSIVPTSNGLRIATQTLLINFAIKVQKDLGVEDSVREPIKVVSDYMSTAKTFTLSETLSDNTERTIEYYVSMYGTQPAPGERVQHPQLGDSMTYSFYINFSFVENGINSLTEKLYFVYTTEFDNEVEEEIPFTEMSFVRSPLSDGAPFSDTGGASKTWHNGTVVEINLAVPAVSNNFVRAAYNYIIKNESPLIKIRYENTSIATNNLSAEYYMLFGNCNTTARGIENVGLSITLSEALKVVDSLGG